MDISRLQKVAEAEWRVEPFDGMHVPVILFGSEALVADMDDKVLEQAANVARLPGIVKASFVMPDGHWGYGFPIGGVAAFDSESGGVISAGGVGFDISCGVRMMLTGLAAEEVRTRAGELADALYAAVPVGLGSKGAITLGEAEMNAMLEGGGRWALDQGYGLAEDLERIEESGRMEGARPDCISVKAKHRQRREMGTLGSGNHYLEVQEVDEIFDVDVASAFGLEKGKVVVSIHCGSRGLGHQIGTEYLRDMVLSAKESGLDLPDRELACAPLNSDLAQRYLGAMRGGINCALANRQIIGHLAREVFRDVFPGCTLPLLFDVSHNTCKCEEHDVGGRKQELFVHRKGATRAFAPGHPSLPRHLRDAGQPVLVGGSMGTASYVLAGTKKSEALAFSSACHGAGRAMSRHSATRKWSGRQITDELAAKGIQIRSPSMRGVAEEAPGAYKDVRAVVDASEMAGLAGKVARVRPIACIKG